MTKQKFSRIVTTAILGIICAHGAHAGVEPTKTAVTANLAVNASQIVTPTSATIESARGMSPIEALERARGFESASQTVLAIPLYLDASRQGLGEASARLMEIYSTGADSVSRNYIASIEFKQIAVRQGVQFEPPLRR